MKALNARWLRRFAGDESGSVTVFTIMVLLAMLLVGGMAIDFIRFKSSETYVQDVSDRAVLAATKLDNEIDPSVIVESYFAAAGIESSLLGSETNIPESSVFRQVDIAARTDVNTFILPLAGIDNLASNIDSTAMQGIGDIEISLVLDVSFSMVNRGPEKINNLRAAAVNFATEALDPEYDGKISLNVIPYSGAVNIGPDMFDYLNGTRYTDGVPYLDTLIEGADTPDDLSDDVQYPNDVTHCLDLLPGDYTSTGLPGAGRNQTAHFLTNSNAVRLGAGYWCPPGADIRYAAREVGSTGAAGSLGHYLANLPMGYGTGTHDAIQYGLALLDPTTQPAFEFLHGRGIVDEVFKDRPLPYDAPGVKKVLVVMTDGAVWHTQGPNDVLDPLNLTDPVFQRRGSWTRTINRNDNFTTFSSVCELAKSPAVNVEVFTVAFETTDAQADIMRECASSDSNFYATSGDGLKTVFGEIAAQISELRLTQ